MCVSLWYVQLESAHHMEETAGGQEHTLWLYRDVDTAKSRGC